MLSWRGAVIYKPLPIQQRLLRGRYLVQPVGRSTVAVAGEPRIATGEER